MNLLFVSIFFFLTAPLISFSQTNTFVTRSGDTLLTGVPIPIKGRRLNPETFKTPSKVIIAQEPKSVPLHPNVRPVGKPETYFSSEEPLVYTPGEDSIPLPKRIPAYGRVVPALQPIEVKALDPRFKDAAILDLQYLGTDQGMKNASISSLFQDSRGRIWIGTSKGVIQYDGIKFKHYTKREGFTDYKINSIIEDRHGQLWFATFGGGVINYDGQNFIHYTKEGGYTGTSANTVFEDSRGHIWFGFAGGVIRYIPNQIREMIVPDSLAKDVIDSGLVPTGSFTHFSKKEGFIDSAISSILEDSHQHLWFSGNKEKIIHYIRPAPEDSLKEGSFTHIRFIDKSEVNPIPGTISPNLVNSSGNIIEDRKGIFWFGTVGKGVHRFDPAPVRNKNWSTLRFDAYTTSAGLASNMVTELYENNKGQIWLSTWEGLVCYTPPTKQLVSDAASNAIGGTFTTFTEKEGLIDKGTTSFLEDDNGLLWIGSYNGVHRLDAASFLYYGESSNIKSPMSLLEDSKGHLWIGTNENGLLKFIPDSLATDISDGFVNGRIRHYQGPDFFGSNITVRCIHEDSRGHLWFGTLRGLIHYVPPEGSSLVGYYRFYGEQEGLPRYGAYRILEDSFGQIWLTTSIGLVRLELNNEGTIKNITYFTEQEGWPKSTISALKDSRGHLWFPHGSVISRFIPTHPADTTVDGTLCHFTKNEGFNKGNPFSAFEDSRGDIWFAMWEGSVVRYDYRPEDIYDLRFVHYKTKDELGDNSPSSIIEDQQRRLWLSTPKGIELFVPEIENEGLKVGMNNGRSTTFNFGKQDGFRTLEERRYVPVVDQSNRIWWSSFKGLAMLDVNKFQQNISPPNIHLDRIEVKQEAIDFRKMQDTAYSNQFEFGEALSHSFDSIAPFFNYPMKLNLPYHIDHLSFNFSGIDWNASDKIMYSYMVDGLDSDWSNPQKETMADYRNLPHGTYTFRVKAIGEAQVWSEPFEYEFTVRPPWWKTNLAYGLYVLLFLVLIYGIYLFLQRRLALQNQLIFEQKEALRLKELDSFKSKLYTNLTHEFRTPLTVIMGMADQIHTNPKKFLDEGINLIKRNSKDLLRLINQLLDLSKLENKSFQLQYRQDDIIPYLQYLTESFHSLANGKNLSLRFFSNAEHLLMDYDAEQIKQVMTNLISNAVKYTEPGGDIKIRLLKKGEYLSIEVLDSGIGIAEKDLPFIFDRFYQVDATITRKGEGTGIGLSHTKELVKLMGGNISVKSSLGQGSSFFVNLPIRNTAVKIKEVEQVHDLSKQETVETDFISNPPISKPAQALTPEANTNSKNIHLPQLLLVEDNPDVVIYLKACLEDLYQIDIAYNGRIGIEKALENIPDLIISDVMMPEKDGFEVCDTLKNDERTSHIPIILLTAKADIASKIAGLKRGADAYLAKPFEKEELLVRLEMMVEKQKKLKAHFSKNNQNGNAIIEEAATPGEAIEVENIFVQKVRNIVEEHYQNENFALPQLCQKIGMSRSQLFRKMKALMDVSPSDYIRSYRLNKARHLLENSDKNVAEAAYAVGFSDPSYFSKMFQGEFGYLPSSLPK